MFTIVFVFFLLATISCQWYLSHRHIRYVARHANAVPEAFIDKISLDSHQRSARYTITKQRFALLKGLVDAMIVVALTLLGGIQWLQVFIMESTLSALVWTADLVDYPTLQTFLMGLLNNDTIQPVVLFIAVMAIISLLELPFQLWSQFKIEADFGFNKMTLKLFIKDTVLSLIMSSLFFIPLLLAVLWFIQSAPNAWWFWTWCVFCGFNLLMLVAYPKWIAPLFNKFTPLSDQSLQERIAGLAQRCGFELNELFVMDGSKRSAHGNAYFTGLGKSKRIVFFDTLLAKLTPSEIEAVLAHELGHFHHRHIIKRIISIFAITFLVLWLLGTLVQMPWFYSGLGVQPNLTNTTYPAIALLLFMIIAPYFTFFLTPISSFISRKHEFQADQYAVNHSSADDLVQALVKLYHDNSSTLTPDPIYSAFYDSHPPASIRIAHLQGSV